MTNECDESIRLLCSQHGLAVTEVHRTPADAALYEHAIRHEKDASIAENGALVATPASNGASQRYKRVLSGCRFEKDLVGTGYPVRRAHVPNQSASARCYLKRASGSMFRRLRRLGSEVPHQVRVICTAVSRALNAHNAHVVDA